MLSPELPRLIRLARNSALGFLAGSAGLADQISAAPACNPQDFSPGWVIYTPPLRLYYGVKPYSEGITQYLMQLIPYNNDGPGIMPGDYWGNGLDLTVNQWNNKEIKEVRITPEKASGEFLLLPENEYKFRVRASCESRQLSATSDAGWGEWKESVRPLPTYREPPTNSSGIRQYRVGGITPQEGVIPVVLTSRPNLQWDNTDRAIWWYEIQLSKDKNFNTDPQTATAAVFWELRHGGLSKPPNSYQVKERYPLEPGQTYHWRVRPRIQGKGTPVDWSRTFEFKVAPNAT